MKKKGFTLVELLGVIAVIAIVLIVTIPVIISSLKKIDNDKGDNDKKSIIAAAELYVGSNLNDFPGLKEENGYARFTVETLIKEGYLKSADYNSVKTQMIGICRKNGGALEYEYPSSGTICGDEVITVYFEGNGGYVANKTKIYKKTGSTYGDLPTPKRDGYTFKGWSKSGDESPQYVTSSSTLAQSTNHTLTAVWEKNS